MSKHDPLARQLEQLIQSVIDPLNQAGVDIISPEHIANAVDHKIDPDQLSPEMKTYASMMQIRSAARRLLARNYDPLQKAADYVSGDSDDLFAGLLQDRYPVKRDGIRGYALRDVMTEADVAFNSSRMRKAGETMLQHSDALDAWHKSRSTAA
jgi:hypothetical protein